MEGKARSKWGELTEDEVQEAQGDREALEGAIQKRYGRTKEEAKAEVDDWLNSN